MALTPGLATNLWLALALCHVHVLAFVLFIGCVYQHDVCMYVTASEDCTNMHMTSTQQKAQSAFICAQNTYHDMHLLMQTIIKKA